MGQVVCLKLGACEKRLEGDDVSMISRIERTTLIRVLAMGWIWIAGVSVNGQSLDEVWSQINRGEYPEAERQALSGLRSTREEAPWAEAAVTAMLAQGKDKEAAANAISWARYDRRGLRLRWLAVETAKRIGDEDTVQMILFEMNQRVSRSRSGFETAEDLVVIGKMALELGADAKLVMKNFFEPVREKSPAVRSLYLAAGELSVAKGDFALASKWYQWGDKEFPADPEMALGLARCFAESDAAQAGIWIEKALERNPGHVGTKLLLVDMMLNSESLSKSLELLDEIEEVNPLCPEMWAYRAAIAHLQNDPDKEEVCRKKGLELNPLNARVPYVIGMKLSQQYRFREGSNYQRMALAMQPNFLPSKTQLAQDLLRLGKNDEGWKLAEEVHQKDGYDVTAFNLTSLKENLESYVVRTNAHFIVRVDAREADILADRALEILEIAYENLTTRFGWVPPEPTSIEIFSSTADFEVRTFGMPNIPGYLGVCFGPVITANSPSTTRMQSVNWESVLWHEFCHTVTLGATRNRMPRWLSEGLSVFEETQANPAWGIQLKPQFLQWIEAGDLLPVSELTSGFMNPKTPAHIEFAYYQSSMVVKYLLEKYGDKLMADLLKDLSRGMEINDALEKNYQSVDRIDRDFTQWLASELKLITGSLTFARNPARSNPINPFGASTSNNPLLEESIPSMRVEDTSNNYWTLISAAMKHLEADELDAAEAIAQKITSQYKQPREMPNPLWILAEVQRKRQNPDKEREILNQWAQIEVLPIDQYQRLVELAESGEDWSTVEKFSREQLAINPFSFQPYKKLAVAYERMSDLPQAYQYWNKALSLASSGKADIHYKMFELSRISDPDRAYGHLLESLADAPRHRQALQEFRLWNRQPENKNQNDG